ncbi:MAG: hypothetical protein SF123_25350 [Chloroflexota bacterium]|nr:hypothetical protein [Chloroflexota bacterium]
MRHLMIYAFVALLLAACNGGAPTVPLTDEFDAFAPVEWDRSPETILFRADIVGGNRETQFAARNDIPICTVYGDNRVVWTNDLDVDEQQVLFDVVTDQQIQTFIEFLTISDRIFSYPGQVDVQLPSSEAPVYELIEINIAGESFTSDSFSGWPTDLFTRVVERCKNISVAPVLFEPTGGWLSVTGADFNFDSALYNWDRNATGISLAEIAASGQRRWISDRNVVPLWNLLRTTPPSRLLTEDNFVYEVALEVPRVTRYSPPPG